MKGGMLKNSFIYKNQLIQAKIFHFVVIFIMIFIGFFQNTIQYGTANGQTASEGKIPISNPFGVCHGWGNTPTDASDLKKQGVQITRNDITWAAVEPENGTYNFKHYDDFFGNISAKNIEALAILDYGNGNIYGSRYANHIPIEQVPHWLSFVNATVSRYQNLVKYWEIWNEPNLDGFWNGTDAEFFYLLNQTAHLIRSINSSLIILAPGISGHNPNYLSSMIEYMGAETFNSVIDVLNYHPYSGSNAEIIDSKAKQVKSVAEKYGFDGEIWVTEVGISTQIGSYETQTQDLERQWRIQAEQLVKIYPILLANGVSRIVWYCYRDTMNPDWFYGEHMFGIQHYVSQSNSWIYKPSGFAYQFLSGKLTNSTYYPNALGYQSSILIPKNNYFGYYFLQNTGIALIITWSQSLPSRFEIDLPQVPKNLLDKVKISQFLYLINRSVEYTVENFSKTYDNTPIIFEIDVSAILGQLNLANGPLIVQLLLDVEDSYEILICGIPIAFLVAVIAIWRKKSIDLHQNSK